MLLWNLQHASTYEALVKAARKRNVELSEALANPPCLDNWNIWVRDAFPELSTCRQVGMGSGPIPWTAIDQYAARHQIFGASYDLFVYLIRRMDDAFLKYKKSEADKNATR